jgi:hypothetical protein
MAFLSSLAARSHLGACDADVEGTWTWITGEAWSGGSWASGEPNGGEAADCLAMNAGDSLIDEDCRLATYSTAYICEFGL